MATPPGRPTQDRLEAVLADDPAEVSRLLEVGAEKAQEVAARTLAAAQQAIGLVPRRGDR